METKITLRKLTQKGLTGALAVTPLALTVGCAAPELNLKGEMARLDQPPETRARHKSYIDTYAFDQCVECGHCLQNVFT